MEHSAKPRFLAHPAATRHSFPAGTLHTLGEANLPWPQVAAELAKGRFPEKIRGNFAFVWENAAETVAAVDHLASYPLFFTAAHVSPNFRALRETLPSPTPNPKLCFQLEFLGGHSVGPETTVREIQRLEPGHYWRNGQAHRYLNLHEYRGEESLNVEFFSHLVESEVARLARAENALLLSGGTDSTALAGIVKKLGLLPRFRFVHAYSDAQALTESAVVNATAAAMEIDVHHAHVRFSGDGEPQDFWVENPFPGKKRALLDSGCAHRRVFTGELGDQLFGGPKNGALLAYALQAPKISPEEVATIWINLSATYGRESGTEPAARLRRTMEDPHAREAFLEIQATLADHFRRLASPDFLHRVMMLNFLVKGPYRTWAYSQDDLDWAHPFAAWEICDYAFRLRSDQKIGAGGVPKQIFLEAWRPFLSELPWRIPKHGFGIPAPSKLRAPSRTLADRPDRALRGS